MLYRAFRYDLRPTAAQAQTMREWIGVTRLVYNCALEQRRDFARHFRRATGKYLGCQAQSREITTLRAEYPWIADVPRTSLDLALMDLDKAFAAFFAGHSDFPTPRVKFKHDSIRLQAKDLSIRRLNAKWSAVRLPRIGWVKFRDTRARRGRWLSITVSLKAGRWSISLLHEVMPLAAEVETAAVGVDRGIAQTLTLSNGEVHQAPAVGRLTRRRKRAQRVAARRMKGSVRQAAARMRAATLYARSGRVRADWCHRTSADLARRFGLVAIEDLKIKNMTASAKGTREAPGRNVSRKAGLNRSILEQSWGRFAAMLEYKLAERGGVLISVPPAYTSQTCASCGVVDARSRESQAVFRCVHCDHTDNADVNAAKEILRRSTAWLSVEGSHFEPAEALIMAATAA